MPERCLNCRHSGKDCIPHLMALAATDLLTWCKDRKKQLGLSNADIAEKSNVPKGTIDRIFGKEVYTEFRFTTIQPIIRVLTGCKMEDLDCAEHETVDQKLLNTIEKQEEHIKALEKENAYLLKQEERYIEEYKALQRQAAENMAGMRQLCRVRLKAIIALSVLLAIALGVIITALIVDRTNPDKGFFWRTITAFFTGIKGNIKL